MLQIPSDILVGRAIDSLLQGDFHEKINPELYGKYYEVIAALYEVSCSNGIPGVQAAYKAFTSNYPELEGLVYPFKQFHGFSAYELGKMDIPPPKFLVDGVIPEGCSLLAAAPKNGKTLLAINIAYAIATGGIALGRIPVSKASVLFLALEGSKRGLKRRLELLAQGEVYPDNLHFFQKWNDKDNGGYELLRNWIERHPDTGLIVVDTLKRIRGVGDSKRSIYDLDYDALQPLSALSEETGVPIIVIHHTRKAESRDPLEMVSGSHGLTGAVDNVLVMQRARGQADALLTLIPREENEAELALRFDAQINNWVLIGDAAHVAKTEPRQCIIELLKSEGRPMKPSEMAKLLKEKPDNIRQLCFKMRNQGKLTQPKFGFYDLHP